MIDVPIAGDPDPIAQADDAHLPQPRGGHARRDGRRDGLPGGSSPTGVMDGTATFRLRASGRPTPESPTDTEALHAALRVVREHTDDAPLG